MPHSSERHVTNANEYDATIRRYLPHYDEMLVVVLEWLSVALAAGADVLDLGGGTGALAGAVAERFPQARVQLWDTDKAMLAVADHRLRDSENVRLVERSFLEQLPPADAVVASFSLHHVGETADKITLYRSVFDSLRPGGIFLNVDCVLEGGPTTKDHYYRQWEEFMSQNGIPPTDAQELFRRWAEEDTYFSVADELGMLQAAGFGAPECF